jgi:capsular exopolysaccharide synthesis family protein
MRKPSVHKNFRITNTYGISDILLQKKKVTEVAYSYNKNLSIITAGKVPPNPAEMLASKAMTAFLKEMKDHFDYIVLDTPPVQAVADAQILSTKTDGTLVVVRAGVTKKDEVKNTINTLNKINANIIGTILHAVDNTRNKYQYYYENE